MKDEGLTGALAAGVRLGWQPVHCIRFEFVIIRVDSARFDSRPVERLNSRP